MAEQNGKEKLSPWLSHNPICDAVKHGLSVPCNCGYYEAELLLNRDREVRRAIVEECALAAEQVAAARYSENSIDWNDGFGRGADAAADRIREIINPQQPSAA